MSVSLAANVQAQTADDEIIVTGSRIPQDPNIVSSVPVQSLTDEALRLSGEISLSDVINDVPALVSSLTAENSADGASALNLRGLGNERTLTLVNGRRHIAGFEGTQAVDLGSIPQALIERVEVLTGGASAVYGSDAVTGVVNFILKDDFEGMDFDVRAGISDNGDAENFVVRGLIGKNFAQDRGNITIAVDYIEDTALRYGDRNYSRNNGGARSLSNPALRFQRGNIGTSTPNFNQFYNFANTGRYNYGFRIPTAAAFIASYTAEFGTAPTLTTAEQALIDQAANAPSRAILPQPTFSITSAAGVISPGNFGLANQDLDGNGVDDCLDSFVGFNNSLVGTGSFGFAGGCYVVNDDGSVRNYVDGLIAGNFNQFGGDGIPDDNDLDFLLPETDTFTINVNTNYELAPNLEVFLEGKYSNAQSKFGGPLNTFYDLLTIAVDNPFIPAELVTLANNTGGLFITRDPTDLGPNIDFTERETIRLVGGMKWQLDNDWAFELSANYGQFTRTRTNNNFVILDRFFAAIDAIDDPNNPGNAICRSDISAGNPPTTIFGIPAFDAGIYSFTPGDGQCRAANILGGRNSISQEAVDFITTTVVDELQLTQSVISGIFTGDSSPYFELPAGPVGFALGGEYRRETSQNIVNDLSLGILPAGSPFGAGNLVSSVSGNGSLGFNASSQSFNSAGSFAVKEAFAEVRVPLLRDLTLFKQLTLDAAIRHADYTTSGTATAWKIGGTWVPVDDITLRGTVSQAVRAPNINELFSPDNPAFFRPVDPCDATELANAADPALRTANCLALGLPAGYVDPLSARFAGVAGGNPNLGVETADTIAIGAVIRPRWIDGLSLTVDYWDVKIANGIANVSAQNIVDQCVDNTSGINNAFCDAVERNTNPASAQFGGFTFLRQSPINFAKIEASGVDFAANYKFDWAENKFGASLVGSRQIDLNFFTNPSDLTQVNPELGEITRPEWSGNLTLSWQRGPFAAAVQTTYQSKQTLAGVEIETVENLFGPAGFSDDIYIFDANGSYEINDRLSVYGGVNNITEETPFLTQDAFPVGPRGRFFFFGVRYKR